MQSGDVVRLFDYMYWIRDRILQAAENLPDEAFRSTDTVATRDLRSTLVHELDVESSWRERLTRLEPQPDAEIELHASDYPTVEALARHWRADETAMRGWIGGLTDAQLVEHPAHERAQVPLADYLLHIVGHAIEEFTEAALLLTRSGHPPGHLEFLDYVDPRD